MIALENWYQFTDDECRQLGAWQERFNAEQDSLNQAAYKRLEFAKWLVAHGVLNEWGSDTSTASVELP